jgi:lactate dehydrogenase-like 2-hydroxyacid dehydrogenase
VWSSDRYCLACEIQESAKGPYALNLSRTAIVVAEQAAQALAAHDLTHGASGVFSRRDEAIAQPLVTAFLMIVEKILTNGILQPALAK